jgi:PAS domain S-box-containing protein
MRFLPFLDFLSLLVYLYLAIYIIIKNPKSLLNRACSGLLLCFAVWSVEMVFVRDLGISKNTARLFFNIGSFGWIGFSSFFLWFALIFTENKKILKTRLFYLFLFILPLILVYKQWTGFLLVVYIKQPYGWSYVFADSIWKYLFYLCYMSFMAISFYLLLDFARKTESIRKKKQAKIIFSTASIAILAGTFTDVILPEMRLYTFPNIASLAVLIWAWGIVYSMVKYKFLVITPVTAVENIMSTMPGSLILLDRNGEIVRVNKALQDLLGYRIDEIKGQSADMLFGKEALKGVLDKCIKEGYYKNYSLFFKTKSGLDIPIDLSASVLKDEEKEIAGIVCIAIDTTERKKLDEALRESDVSFRAIFDHANDGILLADEETKKFYTGNNTACQMLGYSLEEIKNLGVPDIHPKEDLPYVFEQFQRQTRKEIAVAKNLPVKRKDGTVFYADVNTSSVTLAGRTYLLGLFRDITERKDAEEKIRHAAEEWRATFDSIVDLVCLLDKDFKILRANKAVANAFKMQPKEVIGRRCFELFHNSAAPPQGCPHRQAIESKKPAMYELFEPQLGIYLEISCSPFFNQQGEVVGTVQIAKDITERKKVEKDQQLAQLGRLVADMAHEVNNPLMVISGRAQLSLMEETKDEEINGNLKIIMGECHRAKDIIQRLLRFSRPSRGELKEIDINKSIEAIVNLVERQFKLANIEIRRNYLRNPPLILADEQQLQEVFMNLFNNAQDAMLEGGMIEITTSCQNKVMRIDVKDTGYGMSEEDLKKIFQPFFTTKEKGTGLGLSVCYGIIKVHGGEIKLASKLGGGTTVTILLPIEGGKANA